MRFVDHHQVPGTKGLESTRAFLAARDLPPRPSAARAVPREGVLLSDYFEQENTFAGGSP